MMFNFLLIMIGFVCGVVLCAGWMRRSAKTVAAPITPHVDKLGISEELERYRRGQLLSRVGTWELSFGTPILHWSEEVYEMFGYQPGEIHPTYDLFCNAVHPEDRQMVLEAEEACMKRQEYHDIEYRVVWPNGAIRWLRETGDVLVDDDGHAEMFAGTIRDVTDSKKEVDRIRHQANFDDLTGLPNRVHFKTSLQDALDRAKRHGAMLALVYMDLNKFKAVNDKYGHGAGDQVLITIAQRLTHSIRRVDKVARIGGDEFVAILEGIKADGEVQVVVDKLRATFDQPFEVDGQSHNVGVSIGVSCYPKDTQDMEELINLADRAMYQAKKSTPPET